MAVSFRRTIAEFAVMAVTSLSVLATAQPVATARVAATAERATDAEVDTWWVEQLPTDGRGYQVEKPFPISDMQKACVGTAFRKSVSDEDRQLLIFEYEYRFSRDHRASLGGALTGCAMATEVVLFTQDMLFSEFTTPVRQCLAAEVSKPDVSGPLLTEILAGRRLSYKPGSLGASLLQKCANGDAISEALRKYGIAVLASIPDTLPDGPGVAPAPLVAQVRGEVGRLNAARFLRVSATSRKEACASAVVEHTFDLQRAHPLVRSQIVVNVASNGSPRYIVVNELRAVGSSFYRGERKGWKCDQPPEKFPLVWTSISLNDFELADGRTYEIPLALASTDDCEFESWRSKATMATTMA